MQQVGVLREPSSSLYGYRLSCRDHQQIQKRAQSTDFGEIGLGLDGDKGKRVFFDVNRASNVGLSCRLTGAGR